MQNEHSVLGMGEADSDSNSSATTPFQDAEQYLGLEMHSINNQSSKTDRNTNDLNDTSVVMVCNCSNI